MTSGLNEPKLKTKSALSKSHKVGLCLLTARLLGQGMELAILQLTVLNSAPRGFAWLNDQESIHITVNVHLVRILNCTQTHGVFH